MFCQMQDTSTSQKLEQQYSDADNMLTRMRLIAGTVGKQIQSYATSVTSKKLEGKVAVVTASTEGIGFAVAKNLANNGASVVVSSRKKENVNEAVKKLEAAGLKNITGVVCHVGKADDRKNLFKTAVEKFGGVDILVSNAAVNPSVGLVLDCEEEVWDKIFDINVKAAFLLAKEALPLIRKRGGGSIIFISSIAAYQPLPMLGVYSISKTALLGLTKTVATELATENIRVNCVAPGLVDTKFSSSIVSGPGKDVVLQLIPTRRIAQPEDIAGTVTFLCSNDASYITGETLVVAGGMLSRL